MGIQERITQCWNSAARGYDDRPGHGLLSDKDRTAWVDTLRALLPEQPGDVLDLGTGTGFLAFRTHELGHRAAGIDVAEDMLRTARAVASALPDGPSFLFGDAVRPPFRPASFDAITNRHLLWTLREPAQALAAWRAVLRPGGRLLVIDNLMSAQRDRMPENPFYTEEVLAQLPVMQAETVDDVAAILESGGFTEVERVDLSAVDEAEGELDATKGRYGLVATRAG